MISTAASDQSSSESDMVNTQCLNVAPEPTDSVCCVVLFQKLLPCIFTTAPDPSSSPPLLAVIVNPIICNVVSVLPEISKTTLLPPSRNVVAAPSRDINTIFLPVLFPLEFEVIKSSSRSSRRS
ncbi:MAG: Uncharacterised protein [Chloroflexota bacterium]|nr:MAG: Uncharacterised protein [Chloroflexota bacterium]